MTYDPPSPIVIVRTIFGVAIAACSVVLVFLLISTGHVEWKLVALIGALWTIWGVAAHVFDSVLHPLFGFLGRMLFFGRTITIQDEIAYLEDRLSHPALPRDREILAAVRLAEIYRRYHADLPKANALLDRLLVKYPDAPELRYARGLRT